MFDLSQFSPQDRPRIQAMIAGGAMLGTIREALQAFARVGVTFEAIEKEAQRLIKQAGAQPSFSTVRDYQWATCIMKNDALCHGIPRGNQVALGDIVTIDVGLLYEGYHSDTTTTFSVGTVSASILKFLEVGKKSLASAIGVVRAGASVYDISLAMEQPTVRVGYGLVEETVLVTENGFEVLTKPSATGIL